MSHKSVGRISRRDALAAAGTVAASTAVLSACTTYGEAPSAPGAQTPRNESVQPGGAGQPGGGAQPAGLARTDEVPVGGGTIVGDTVLTQPEQGTFLAFDSRCTHAGCAVSSIANGAIKCTCHGSTFGLDGTVRSGPARSALAAKRVVVDGSTIRVVE